MQNFEPEFDFTYTIDADGNIGNSTEYAPIVTHDEDDIEIDSSGWGALRGYTGQYMYSAAVMHPSEQWGQWAINDLKRHATENNTVHFAVVPVYDAEDEHTDDSTVGWAVAYKVVDN